MWRLEGNQAELATQPILSRLDVTRPWNGLVAQGGGIDLALERETFAWLQVRLEHISPDLIEKYLRGTDLIATYVHAQRHDVRAQVYWRGIEPSAESPGSGVELIVSAQTGLLESHPAIVVQSCIPALEILQPLRGEPRRLESVQGSAHDTENEFSTLRPGMFLCRLPGSSWSYLEMVHPSDDGGAQLSTEAGANSMTTRFRLFTEPMEKGVIRRARIRGVFLPRAGDRDAAAQCYEQFSAEVPPLTT